MAGFRFRDNGDGEVPVFNQYGLPVVCGPGTDWVATTLFYETDETADAEVVTPAVSIASKRYGWTLEATATGTSNASVTFPLPVIAGAIRALEIDLGYVNCRYAAVELLNVDGVSSSQVAYLDLQDQAVVSADSGLTVTVPGGGDVGARYRIEFTAAATIGTPSAKLYMASTSGSKTFSGSVGDKILLGTDLYLPSTPETNPDPDNIRILVPGTTPSSCCAPCESLSECLARTPIKITMPGIHVSDWLSVLPGDPDQPSRVGNGMKVQAADGSTDVIFDGTWLFYPMRTRDFPGEPWPGEASNLHIPYFLHLGEPWVAWQTAGYRTIVSELTPALKSRIYLYLQARCVTIEDVPSVVFLLAMRTLLGLNGCYYDVDDEWLTAMFWPIAQSAAIPLEGLELSELVNVDLTPYVSPAPGSDYAAFFPPLDFALCGGYTGDCEGECWWIDEADFDAAPVPTLVSETDGGSNLMSLLSFSCAQTDPEDGGDQCDTVVQLFTGATPVRTTTTIDFEYTPTGCYKRFTAIYPPALDYCWNGEEYVYQPPEFYWSFGQTGSSVLHRIDGPPDSDIGASETVTMTMFVCDAACGYTVIKEVDCSCLCTGTVTPPSMSLAYTLHEVTPPEFGVPCTDYPDAQFTYRLTVTGAADPDCDSEFMEVQISSEGPWSVLSCCPCPVGRDDPDGTACTEEELEAVAAFAYTNGQTIDFSIGLDEPACVRYRTWDSCCGCPGPWSYYLFFVECEASAPDPDDWCPWL